MYTLYSVEDHPSLKRHYMVCHSEKANLSLLQYSQDLRNMALRKISFNLKPCISHNWVWKLRGAPRVFSGSGNRLSFKNQTSFGAKLITKCNWGYSRIPVTFLGFWDKSEAHGNFLRIAIYVQPWKVIYKFNSRITNFCPWLYINC